MNDVKIVQVPPKILQLLEEHRGRLVDKKEYCQRLKDHRSVKYYEEDIATIDDFIVAHHRAVALDEATCAYGWRSEGMQGMALGHSPPTPENSYKFHERKTVVLPLMIVPGHEHATYISPEPEQHTESTGSDASQGSD